VDTALQIYRSISDFYAALLLEINKTLATEDGLRNKLSVLLHNNRTIALIKQNDISSAQSALSQLQELYVNTELDVFHMRMIDCLLTGVLKCKTSYIADAIECFEKGVAGDYEECNRLMKILTSRYCYDIPAMTKDPRITKAFREMREWFRKAEVESAKRLIIIEQKAALGEIIDIDAELERFKERLLIIKRNNSEAALKAHPEISPNDYMTEEELETLSRFFKNDEPGISF
jgi:hypothetical protein